MTISGALSLGVGIAAGALPYPLVNGYAFSYASVELKFRLQTGLITVKGVKSCNYKSPRERAKLWGTHPAPYAKTMGKQDHEADVELYLAEAVNLVNSIGPGWGDIQFDMHVTYNTPGYPLITDVIKQCNLDSPEQSFTSGDPAALTRKFTLAPLSILYNGNSLFSSPLGGLISAGLNSLGI
jgi:hypothetical protein